MKKIIIVILFLGSSISFATLLPRFDITAYGLTGQQSNSAGELEGIVPLYSNNMGIIYTDIRGLAYIQDSMEGNVSLGWRHRWSSNVTYGVHGGVDIRRTQLKNYFQQTAFGAEYWWKKFFVGLNGYVPFIGVQKVFSTYDVVKKNSAYRTLNVTDFAENAYAGSDLWLGYKITPKIQMYIRFFYFGFNEFKAYVGGAVRGEYKFSGKGDQAIKGWLSHISIFAEGKYDTYNKVVGSGGVRVSLSDPNQQQNHHFMDLIRRDMDVITVVNQTSPTVDMLSPDGTEIHIYDVNNEDELKMAKNHQDANVIALHGNFDVTKAGSVADLNRDVTLTGKDFIYTGSDGKSHTLKVSDGAQITFSKEQPLFAVTTNVHNIIVRDLTVNNAGSIFATSTKDNNQNNTGGDLYHKGINVSYINDILFGTFNTVFTSSNNNITIKDSEIKTSKPIHFMIDGSNFNLMIDNTKFTAGGGMIIDVTGYTKTTKVDISITNSKFDLTNPTSGSFESKGYVTSVGNSGGIGLSSEQGVVPGSYGIPSTVNGIAINVDRSNLKFVLNNNKFYGIPQINKSFISINNSIANYSKDVNAVISTTFDVEVTNNVFQDINITFNNSINPGSNKSGPTYTMSSNVNFKNNILSGQTGLYPFSYNTYTNEYKNAVLHTTLNIESNTIELDDSQWKMSKSSSGSAAIYVYLNQGNNADSSANISITKNDITVKDFPYLGSNGLGTSADFVFFTFTEAASPVHMNISSNTMVSNVVPDADHLAHVASVALFAGNDQKKYLNLTFKNNNITVPSLQWVVGQPEPVWQQHIDHGTGYKPVIMGFYSSNTYTATINGLTGIAGLNTLDVGGLGNNTYHNP